MLHTASVLEGWLFLSSKRLMIALFKDSDDAAKHYGSRWYRKQETEEDHTEHSQVSKQQVIQELLQHL